MSWGTSTWTYEGWEGIVYRDVRRYGRRFRRDSLKEYAESGRFDCVGIDNTFYRPADRALLAHYASLLPPGFPCILKAWQAITAPFFTRHFGPRGHEGEPNPDFLDVRRFLEDVAAPIVEVFAEHTAAVVLEFPLVPPRDLPVSEFLARLDAFLSACAGVVPLAVEVRSRWWVGPRYVDVLSRHHTAHAFNVWTSMPLPDEVSARWPALLQTGPMSVCRALVAPGMRYADAVKRYQPYDRIRDVRPDVRRSLVALALEAVERGVDLYVTVNNRLEGCAPLTIEALRRDLDEALRVRQSERELQR